MEMGVAKQTVTGFLLVRGQRTVVMDFPGLPHIGRLLRDGVAAGVPGEDAHLPASLSAPTPGKSPGTNIWPG